MKAIDFFLTNKINLLFKENKKLIKHLQDMQHFEFKY